MMFDIIDFVSLSNMMLFGVNSIHWKCNVSRYLGQWGHMWLDNPHLFKVELPKKFLMSLNMFLPSDFHRHCTKMVYLHHRISKKLIRLTYSTVFLLRGLQAVLNYICFVCLFPLGKYLHSSNILLEQMWKQTIYNILTLFVIYYKLTFKK